MSIIAGLVSYAYYGVSIWRGDTRPHAFTWISWTVIVTVVFFAQHYGQAGAGAWPTAISALSCGAIAAMSLWRGERRIVKADWVVFIATLSAIPLWYLTADPTWAVILLVVIDCMGIIPTVRKSWLYPRSETLVWFVLNIIKYSLAMLAMEERSLVTMLFPISSASQAFLFIVMVSYRRNLEKRRPELFARVWMH